MFRTALSSLFALVLLVVASSTHAASADRPFKGSESSAWVVVGAYDEYIEVASTATGHYTHWGLTTSDVHQTINMLTGAGFGTSVYTAADGDQIFHEFVSQAISETETYYVVTVTGGTGRFADATGSYTGVSTITSSDGFSGTADAWFEGTFNP
jgi:hypothetical protein